MRYKGSFTIEAALVMPIVLGVIVLFINTGMFCHDRCVMEYICQSACMKTVYEHTDDEDAASEHIRQELEHKLICKWDTEVSILRDERGITATVKARHPLFDRIFVHTARAAGYFSPKY